MCCVQNTQFSIDKQSAPSHLATLIYLFHSWRLNQAFDIGTWFWSIQALFQPLRIMPIFMSQAWLKQLLQSKQRSSFADANVLETTLIYQFWSDLFMNAYSWTVNFGVHKKIRQSNLILEFWQRKLRRHIASINNHKLLTTTAHTYITSTVCMEGEALSQGHHAAKRTVDFIFVHVFPLTHHHNVQLTMPANLPAWLKLQPARNPWVAATVRHPESTTPPFL